VPGNELIGDIVQICANDVRLGTDAQDIVASALD
jgi:hypothetical protein